MLGAYSSAAFTNASGLAVAAGAAVEIRRESDSALASIFEDRDGTTPIAQPGLVADASGRFTVYMAAIEAGYSVEVDDGAESHMLRNVQVSDPSALGISLMEAASAAAARLAAGFAALAAKGSSWWASAANVVAELTVGVNGEVMIADSSQAAGVKWGVVPLPMAAIAGLTYSNNGADATNDIDIAAGAARNSDNSESLVLAAALTKRLDAAWAVGTGNGGLDTGSIGNSDYYIHLIKRVDTGVVDALFSLSATAPTMPANYDKRRLIGWFKRVGATIVAFTTYEIAGGGIEHAWTTPTLDVNLANTLTTSRRTDALKVPLNFATLALFNVYMTDGVSQNSIISCPDMADAAPSSTVAPLSNLFGSSAVGNVNAMMRVRTSATGTIAARSNTATIDLYAVVTLGFEWGRRNAL